MPGNFVHLHLHTDHSLLRGTCRIRGNGTSRNDLASFALEQNFPALAVTDFFTLGGVPEFFSAMKSSGVKPIAGCEILVRSELDPGKAFPLVLLVRNSTGYRNLCRLLAGSDHSTIPLDSLAANCEGLSALSGGPEGELSASILSGDLRKTEKVLARYLDLFGKENFHPEVTDHGSENEKIINRGLAELSRSNGLKLAATNKVRYLRKADALEYAVVNSIRTGTQLKEPASSEYYCKSFDEMNALFGTELPEALSNTLDIAERCEFKFEFHRDLIPNRSGGNPIDILRAKALANFPLLYGNSARKEEILARLEKELKVLDSCGMNSYFLAVSDLTALAKKEGIPFGQTDHASGAESLTAYLCGITQIDPVENDLHFELFLNPEQKYHPEISLNFCSLRNRKMMDSVIAEYGPEYAAGCTLHSPFKPRNAIRETAKILNIPSPDASKLIKLLPSTDVPLAESVGKISGLDETGRKLFHAAVLAEGGNRISEPEADTLVIASAPLNELIPLTGKGAERRAEYSSAFCSRLGMFRFRFPGSPALTLIHQTLERIKAETGEQIDLAKIPYDDPRVFEQLHRDLDFQLIRPESMEELTALFAVSRSAMKPFASSLAARKNGEESFEYEHPLLEKILKCTFGLVLYREQSAEILHALAGIAYERAESFLRALRSKNPSMIRKEFIAHCSAKGIAAETAEEIFSRMEQSGGGISKANSLASAFTAYQTAYLKIHAPLAFFITALSSADTPEKVLDLTSECREFGISVFLPDIDRSEYQFIAERDGIRCGFSAIRGIPESIAKKIIAERKEHGSYADFPDFVWRCGDSLNKKTLEILIRSGTLDSLKLLRSQMLASADDALRISEKERKDLETGQGSLFALDDSAEEGFSLPIPNLPELDEEEKRQDEKVILGFSLDTAFFESGILMIRLKECDSGKIGELKELLERHRGDHPVMIEVAAGGYAAKIRLAPEFCADLSEDLLFALEKLLGTHHIVIINEEV